MQLSMCCWTRTSANDLSAFRAEITLENLGAVRVSIEHGFNAPDLPGYFAKARNLISSTRVHGVEAFSPFTSRESEVRPLYRLAVLKK